MTSTKARKLRPSSASTVRKPVTGAMGDVNRRSESTRPASGSTSRLRKKTTWRMRPRKNAGSDTPMSVRTRTPRVRQAARPAGREDARAASPSGMAMSIAAAMSSRVAGSRDMISPRTGRLVPMEMPQSPVSIWTMYVRYWTGSGRSRPSCSVTRAMSAGRALGPMNTAAALLGTTRASRNVMIERPSSTMTEPPSRCSEEPGHRAGR